MGGSTDSGCRFWRIVTGCCDLMRAQGMSALPDGYEWSIDEFVSDVLAVLDHYGIERAHWVGASGGGIIGQHAAASAPDRLASLTLLATTPRFRSPTANVDDKPAPLDRRCR